MIVHGFICEGPRCTKGPNDSRVVVQWDADQIKINPNYSMPDVYFKFLIAQAVYEEPSPNNQQGQPQGRTFCSSGCLRDYFNESRYTAPLSPREQAAQAQVNAAAKDKVDGFGKPVLAEKTVGKVIPFHKPVKHNSAMEEVGGGAVQPASREDSGDGSDFPA